jgi:hypothetical protein
MEDIPEYRRPDGKRCVPKASSVNNFPHGTSEWAFRQLPIDDCRHAFITATSISSRVLHLMFEFAFNSSQHAVTGIAPFTVVYGGLPPAPVSLFNDSIVAYSEQVLHAHHVG